MGMQLKLANVRFFDQYICKVQHKESWAELLTDHCNKEESFLTFNNNQSILFDDHDTLKENESIGVYMEWHVAVGVCHYKIYSWNCLHDLKGHIHFWCPTKAVFTRSIILRLQQICLFKPYKLINVDSSKKIMHFLDDKWGACSRMAEIHFFHCLSQGGIDQNLNQSCLHLKSSTVKSLASRQDNTF